MRIVILGDLLSFRPESLVRVLYRGPPAPASLAPAAEQWHFTSRKRIKPHQGPPGSLYWGSRGPDGGLTWVFLRGYGAHDSGYLRPSRGWFEGLRTPLLDR